MDVAHLKTNKQYIIQETDDSTVKVIEGETLPANEDFNYKCDELLHQLNYLNKGNDQATGIKTLEGSNWLDDIVG